MSHAVDPLYIQTERNRHASLRRTVQILRYLEQTAPRWTTITDLQRLSLGVNRKSLWRYMQALEDVCGLEVRGGETIGIRPIPEALQWRIRK